MYFSKAQVFPTRFVPLDQQRQRQGVLVRFINNSLPIDMDEKHPTNQRYVFPLYDFAFANLLSFSLPCSHGREQSTES
jgi:hypothetical protein